MAKSARNAFKKIMSHVSNFSNWMTNEPDVTKYGMPTEEEIKVTSSHPRRKTKRHHSIIKSRRRMVRQSRRVNR